MKILSPLLIFSVLLAWLPSAQAQGGVQGGDKDKGKKVSFVCASWNPINEDLYYLKGGTSKNPEYEKVSISEMVRSLPHVAREGTSVMFYTLNSSVEYSKVGQVSIPAGSKRYLLLFMPKKDTDYRIMAIPDERKHSPFGAYTFYNFSKLPVHGLLAKTKFEVASGKQKLVQLNLKPGTPMAYATQVVVDGKRQWLQRNTFHFNPKKHAKFFIYQVPSANGRYKVKSKAIVEFKEEPKAIENQPDN